MLTVKSSLRYNNRGEYSEVNGLYLSFSGYSSILPRGTPYSQSLSDIVTVHKTGEDLWRNKMVQRLTLVTFGSCSTGNLTTIVSSSSSEETLLKVKPSLSLFYLFSKGTTIHKHRNLSPCLKGYIDVTHAKNKRIKIPG